MRDIDSIFFSCIGWLYLYVRYGKKRRTIVREEFLNHYDMAGRKFFLQVFAMVLIIGIAALLLVVLITTIIHK